MVELRGVGRRVPDYFAFATADPGNWLAHKKGHLKRSVVDRRPPPITSAEIAACAEHARNNDDPHTFGLCKSCPFCRVTYLPGRVEPLIPCTRRSCFCRHCGVPDMTEGSFHRRVARAAHDPASCEYKGAACGREPLCVQRMFCVALAESLQWPQMLQRMLAVNFVFLACK